MPAKMTHAQFVARARQNPKVKSVRGEYNGQRNDSNKLVVVCSSGHVSEPLGAAFILTRFKCRECYRPKKTTESFAKELKDLDKPFRLLGDYAGDAIKLKVQCKKCDHVWAQTPNTLRYQKNCPLCANKARRNQPHKLTFNERVAQIAAVNPHLAVSNCCRKVGRHKQIHVTCKVCGREDFKQMDSVTRVPLKCPCKLGVNSGRGYSNASIAWLESIARRNRIVIEHARNRGEFKIPGTKMYADGFHRRSGTVFEFLGDYWHKTRESHQKAIGRLKRIKALGYRVIYIWESEFKKGQSAKEMT